jgi:galactose mutarotase-like enzyme
MWSDKVGNVSQVGGIETSVLDNGPGRGMRIAWINTGAGLRYKVLLDRAMDIGDAVFNQYNLAWLSHAGFTPPQSLSDKGLDWLRTFGGGLMSTCGLTHVGGPEKDEHGERGIHGRISNTPAEIVSIIQPDPAVGKMDMSITGIIRESNIFGPCLELRRTITSKLGEASIHIKDEVINRGNTTAPHMLMYHCNFGWPLADKGSRLSWNGVMTTRDGQPFPDADAYMICRDTLPEHNGNGEQVAFIDIESDHEGICRAGLHNPSINLGVSLSFRKSEMPWLTNWQHFGRGEYVTGIEPCTHPPIGQSAARANNTLIFLQPGETKTYHLTIDINL